MSGVYVDDRCTTCTTSINHGINMWNSKYEIVARSRSIGVYFFLILTRARVQRVPKLFSTRQKCTKI